jgi:uncharacterized protein (DUF1015 family)
MPVFNPLRAIRPAPGLSADIVCLPYDVVDTEEARELAKSQKHSFFHVIRSEIEFPETQNPYAPEIYERASANLSQLINDGALFVDEAPGYFLYNQTVTLPDGSAHSQTGIVGLVSMDDYFSGKIKKHELTRREKEADRIAHIDTLSACTGPVFLAYRAKQAPALSEKAAQILEGQAPLYQDTFGNVKHTIVKVSAPGEVKEIQNLASQLPAFYIADGHHRAASAANVGRMRSEKAGKSDPSAPHSFFLAVIFPDSALRIMPYNRALKDANGLTAPQFLDAIKDKFSIIEDDGRALSLHEFRLLFAEQSWIMRANPALYEGKSVIEALDASILQTHVLGPVLGIDDPRSSDRITFMGGIHGESGLRRLIEKGSHVMAFSLHATSMQELLDVADQNQIMPPKSTWFEPKLRSGYIVYSFG